MAVIPALPRQGIGSMLLKEAVKQARAWPADAIRLDAFDTAGAFYANCGFREVGRVTCRKAPPIYFELGLSTTPNSSKPRRDAKTFRQKGLTRKARYARDARLRHGE
jgi:predicted N-acetyltransferase YhbS